MERGRDGRWRVVEEWVSEPARNVLRARHGEGFEMRLPVVEISCLDAEAYCVWKTRVTGRTWRLPTEDEREKAARGVDGRTYPWGEIEDASLGKCIGSREEPSQPEPVGSFPAATSIYGLVDAAGNTFDWTSSWFDARRAGRVARGGSWDMPSRTLRCAFRYPYRESYRAADIGLRPAHGYEPAAE
jgi:formylglycine-generating enzyme required for sulfatase activity